MKNKKRPVLIVLEWMMILLFILILIFNELIIYGISQGKGQLNIVRNSVPIEQVLNNSQVADSIKDKLRLIQEVKNYAFDSLGINRSDNYTTYYEQHGKPLLWVLTAAERYEMKPYQWRFPVVGKVGYKGFFNWNRALIERADLKESGYDTDLGQVGGWSTLGYFKDPVLSQMLRHGEGMLAELIIHELTHGTIYVKSNVTFNENLASFIGEKGAMQFLKMKYGEDSPQMKEYLDARSDQKAFSELALKYANRLEILYKSKVHEELMQQLKTAIIYDFVKETKTYNFHNRRFKTYGRKAYSSGNAFFLSYIRYDSKVDEFEKELNLKYNGNLKSYLAGLKEIHGKK